MKDAYRNMPIYDDFEELKKQGIMAAEGDTRIMKMTDEFMTTLGRARGESEREIRENNRRSMGSVRTNREYGGSTVNLANAGVTRRPSVYDNYGKNASERKVRKAAKETSNKMKKIAITASLALALAGSGVYLGAVIKAQDESFERANEIVNVVDAGDYHPQLGGYELIERANGSYFFRDADGNIFSRYGEGDFLISADEVGELVEQANQSHQR